MSKKEIKLEYKVVNWDVNRKTIEWYNIFNNCYVYQGTIELCEKFKKENLSFEDFAEKLRKTIAWQEWGRCEYECLIAPWPYTSSKDEELMVKIDCYQQANENIKLIAKYVLETYYPKLKVELSTNTVYNIINSEMRK